MNLIRMRIHILIHNHSIIIILKKLARILYQLFYIHIKISPVVPKMSSRAFLPLFSNPGSKNDFLGYIRLLFFLVSFNLEQFLFLSVFHVSEVQKNTGQLSHLLALSHCYLMIWFFSCCVLIVTFIISFMHFWENFQGM